MFGFRTSAWAAARVRVCLKDAALFDRKITGRIDLISRYNQSIIILNSQLLQSNGNNVRLCMHAGNALQHDDFHNLH